MSTRAPALPADERRAAILEAALPLLRERGTSVTTREIAIAAGIAEGTIFRVFPDKSALVAAALAQVSDPVPVEAALAAIDRSLSFEEQLSCAVRVFQRWFTEVWEVVAAVKSGPRRPPYVFVGLVDLLEPFADRLRVDVQECARRVPAITLALSHPAIHPPEPMAPEQIVDMLLHGLGR